MHLLSTERWAEVDALADAALARPPDERTACLRAACGDDPELYRAAADLVAFDEIAGSALGEHATGFAAHLLEAVGAEADAAPEADLVPGDRIGPYRIEGVLGRGGMGVVYRAARADGAFSKEVALKLVKRGMDTDEVLARFRRERQVLAGLDHPGIARLLDAGAAPDGRPYLVMELVDGEPLTAYCDRRRLPSDARLALFEQVGEAVAHAHRRLVVHRDLKPPNVLVTETEDGTARVKLLDFGIARLLGAEADELLTQPGARRLTPAYAAPEQLRGEPVTTAADVYALGVLLHELLAGRRPERPSAGAPPLPPSAAVDADAAAARATTEDGLRLRLRGDLDVICLKALRDEPAERYPSVEALLDDLRRYRTGLPVEARPASAAYRARRFVGRHRAGVAAAAAFVALLVGSVVLLAVQQRATARERDAAEATAAFLEDLFAAADPVEPVRLDTLRAQDLLARGAERAEAELADQPEVQARLLYIIGRTYSRSAMHRRAQPLLERSLALRRQHGAPPEVLARTLSELSFVLNADDLDRAIVLQQEALDLYTAAYGPVHSTVADASTKLVDIISLVSLENPTSPEERELALDNAERRLDALRVALEEASPTHPLLAPTYHGLGHVSSHRGDHDRTEELYRQSIAGHRLHHGDEHPLLGHALRCLGSTYMWRARFDEAEPLIREAIAIERAAFGDQSQFVRQGLNQLGIILRRQGRFTEAEAALREALTISPGTQPMLEAITQGTLASVLMEQGKLAEAEAVQREAIAIVHEVSGPSEPMLAFSVRKLAGIVRDRGRFAEAEALLLETHREMEAAHGITSMAAQTTAGALAELYDAWGRPDEAERHRALLVNDAEPGAHG